VAAAVALLPALRLLELARRHRPEIRRTYRLGLVILHLALPTALWCLAASWFHGSVPVRASIAISTPLVTVLVLAWFRYPSPHVHPLAGPKLKEIAAVAGAAALFSGVVWLAGRPLVEGSSSGLLWGRPHSFNNIRPWIEPWPAKTVERSDPHG
jgi:hypothetical protein